MSPGLQRALDDLDCAIDQRASVLVDGCTYCYDESSLRSLVGPASAVALDLVSSVAGEAPDHWGDFPAVYRKFTPAILRALVYDRLHVDEELVAARLVEAGCWTTWPEAQRRAVMGVLQALLEETLATYPRGPSLDSILRILITTPEPFSTWLDAVDAAPAGAADQHVVELCRSWLPELTLGTLNFGWNDDLAVPVGTLDWLRDQCVRRLLPLRDQLPMDVRSRIALLL